MKNKSVDDVDFLNKEKLIGRVYHHLILSMQSQTVEERHQWALRIMIEVVNDCFPACPSCGTKCNDTTCQSCKYKQKGILGNV